LTVNKASSASATVAHVSSSNRITASSCSPIACWGPRWGSSFGPIFFYGCQDNSNTDWIVASDGSHAVARMEAGRDWQFTDLPAGTGIDWNCDGGFGGSSSENINGSGGGWWAWFDDGTANELLDSNYDWPDLPYHAGNAC
jgi:hypothetical protein